MIATALSVYGKVNQTTGQGALKKLGQSQSRVHKIEQEAQEVTKGTSDVANSVLESFDKLAAKR